MWSLIRAHPLSRRDIILLCFGFTASALLFAFLSSFLSPLDYAPLRLGASGSSTASACARRPLPPSSQDPYNQTRAFHAFDDVLLVVFFSHPRYDAGNLDAHREVYSEFFPNILYIGPGSREDAGFAHSYDVLTDTFKSDEDLSEGQWHMAGRMAHHMLYTAMEQHPCYDGYLFAPFDIFLNIPRLVQFPQDSIWYLSDLKTRYIPNRAQEGGATGSPAEVPRPPGIRLSPELDGDWREKWESIWKDWWWGEPHVGLAACLPAYYNISSVQRERLAELTDGVPRLIGGSVDTAYIPGHLRSDFLDTLGTFLETDCFLEIALPTSLHLVLSEEEEIVWVDHHWTWTPPFDASYVRAQWAKGIEVDTWHRWFWGEPDPADPKSGRFVARPGVVEEVRALLRESWERQGVEVPEPPY